MAMGTGNECFETHLIEEDGTLNRVEIDKFTKKVDLAAYELNYVVVSIMGPQSSGKSTLLNHLFGSKFKEMDRRQGSVKTTKGIWLARCADIEPCTLVMDVEGSDGGDRGEDDTSFERRSGVFALAVSRIVLINMFYTSVGLEHGASKPLLKHVFQGVLRLSTSPHKTTLMFVIRDITDTTDLETSEPILRRNIQKIWDSIPKPESHKGTPLSTFFNIEVEGLPNFMERKEQFKEQVKILRQRFNRSIEPCGLAGHSRRTIRGSDFSLFVQKIWETIMADRELDLPKQEVMLANTRCGEIADQKFKDFCANEERCQLEVGAKTNPATGFGKKYNSIINSYLHGYDEETKNYDKGVRSEKREHLKEKMMLLVQSAIQSIFAQIGLRTLGEFKEAFHKALDKGETAKVASQIHKEACMKSFDVRCADVIVEQANCNTFEEREKLEQAIDSDVQVECLKQEKKLQKAIALGAVGITTAVTGVAAAADAAGAGGAATLAVGLLAKASTAALVGALPASSGVRDPHTIADASTGAAALIAETKPKKS